MDIVFYKKVPIHVPVIGKDGKPMLEKDGTPVLREEDIDEDIVFETHPCELLYSMLERFQRQYKGKFKEIEVSTLKLPNKTLKDNGVTSETRIRIY